MQFEGIVYQQMLGICLGKNSASLMMELFLHCFERDFMCQYHKTKRYDIIDMFNDISQHLDDILTNDNSAFKNHNFT